MAEGFFRSKKGFTVVQNEITRDVKISLKAKGLYLVIQAYISMPDKKWTKEDFRNLTKEGKKAFDSAWKELKDFGYLKVHFMPDNGKWKTEYELLDGGRIVGVIDAIIVVGAAVDDVVPLPHQVIHQGLLLLEAGVVASDAHAHGPLPFRRECLEAYCRRSSAPAPPRSRFPHQIGRDGRSPSCGRGRRPRARRRGGRRASARRRWAGSGLRLRAGPPAPRCFSRSPWKDRPGRRRRERWSRRCRGGAGARRACRLGTA